MALYNSAIYLGRALTFLGLFVFSQTASSQSTGITLVRVPSSFPAGALFRAPSLNPERVCLLSSLRLPWVPSPRDHLSKH